MCNFNSDQQVALYGKFSRNEPSSDMSSGDLRRAKSFVGGKISAAQSAWMLELSCNLVLSAGPTS